MGPRRGRSRPRRALSRGFQAQASVRAEWGARLEARRAALDLAELFTAEGRSWVEAGPDGATVRHPATGEVAASGRPRRRAADGKGAASRQTSLSSQMTDRQRTGRPARGVAAAQGTEGAPSRKTAKAVPKRALVKKAAAQEKTSIRAR